MTRAADIAKGWLERLSRPRGIVPVDENTPLPWPEAEMLREWWFAARRPGGLPSPADIDPKRFGSALARLILHDVEPGRPAFRVRLAGEEYTALMGRQPKGMTFDQLPAASGLRRRYMWAVRNRRPYYTRPLRLSWAARPWRHYQAFVMPLSSDGERVDAILSLGRFF